MADQRNDIDLAEHTRLTGVDLTGPPPEIVPPKLPKMGIPDEPEPSTSTSEAGPSGSRRAEPERRMSSVSASGSRRGRRGSEARSMSEHQSEADGELAGGGGAGGGGAGGDEEEVVMSREEFERLGGGAWMRGESPPPVDDLLRSIGRRRVR